MDELNLWCVATTRAKRVLAVPSKFTVLLHGLQQLQTTRNDNPHPTDSDHDSNKRKHSCGGQAVTLQKALELHNQLCSPWPQELKSAGGLFVHGSKADKQLNLSLHWLNKAINQHMPSPHIVLQLIKHEWLQLECLHRGLVFAAI